MAKARTRGRPTSCRPRTMRRTAPNTGGGVSALKRNRRIEVGPYMTGGVEILRHDVAASAGDGLHREGRRGAGARRSWRPTIRWCRTATNWWATFMIEIDNPGAPPARAGYARWHRGNRVPARCRRNDQGGGGGRPGPHHGGRQGVLGPVRALSLHAGTDCGVLEAGSGGGDRLQPSEVWAHDDPAGAGARRIGAGLRVAGFLPAVAKKCLTKIRKASKNFTKKANATIELGGPRIIKSSFVKCTRFPGLCEKLWNPAVRTDRANFPRDQARRLSDAPWRATLRP